MYIYKTLLTVVISEKNSPNGCVIATSWLNWKTNISKQERCPVFFFTTNKNTASLSKVCPGLHSWLALRKPLRFPASSSFTKGCCKAWHPGLGFSMSIQRNWGYPHDFGNPGYICFLNAIFHIMQVPYIYICVCVCHIYIYICIIGYKPRLCNLFGWKLQTRRAAKMGDVFSVGQFRSKLQEGSVRSSQTLRSHPKRGERLNHTLWYINMRPWQSSGLED